jgi:predicted dehydrogenase
VTLAARVGIVGCGVISRRYAENARAFDGYDVVACADLDMECAGALAEAHGFAATSVSGLMEDRSIDVVLNLTPPQAHAEVSALALRHGKHVYSEKPLAADLGNAVELVADAQRRGLRIGCAPDTFLGPPYQYARSLLDAGAIGAPLAVTAAMVGGGQERWHPNPDIFFADGAGPLLDMGPYYISAIVALLGPIRAVAGFTSSRRRVRAIEVGPRTGESFEAHTPTHTAAVLELEGGVTGTLIASFEASGSNVRDVQVHGTDGTLSLPDPNYFTGGVRLRRTGREWESPAVPGSVEGDARGIGLQDMVESIAAERPHRASGTLAVHIIEVARAILRAGEARGVVEIGSQPERPEPRPVTRAATVPR